MNCWPVMPELDEECEFISRSCRRLSLFRPLAKGLLHAPLPDRFRQQIASVAGRDVDYLLRYPHIMQPVFDSVFIERHGRKDTVYHQPIARLLDYYRARSDCDRIDLYQAAMMEWWLPDDLLHKADRMTMAHSVELRCPFLDREFANYCMHLGLDDRVLPSSTEPCRKVALEKAFAAILPDGIAYQQKKGFASPVHEWMCGPLAEPVRRCVLNKEGYAATIFPQETLSSIVESAAARHAGAQKQLWTLVVLNKWAERWL